MILYKNYIRILGSYVFIFIRECVCNYRVNVLCGNDYSIYDSLWFGLTLSEICNSRAWKLLELHMEIRLVFCVM